MIDTGGERHALSTMRGERGYEGGAQPIGATTLSLSRLPAPLDDALSLGILFMQDLWDEYLGRHCHVNWCA